MLMLMLMLLRRSQLVNKKDVHRSLFLGELIRTCNTSTFFVHKTEQQNKFQFFGLTLGRRWHFFHRGQIAKYFQTHWIPAEDQIADDMTKTQTAAISLKHMNRT